MTVPPDIRRFWEAQACGTDGDLVDPASAGSPAWYDAIAAHRYRVEPEIFALAQFTRFQGQQVLEIGVGAGTDHLQWARAGAVCHGVDLTDTAIATTAAHLRLHGFTSELRRQDAETLPFPDAHFDVVYAYGVIHYAPDISRVVAEIHRVLRPGGVFLGMVYGRRSLRVMRLWLRHALLAGRPWRSLQDVMFGHMPYPGSQGFTVPELHRLFAAFEDRQIAAVLTPYDLGRLPQALKPWLPSALGLNVHIRARR